MRNIEVKATSQLSAQEQETENNMSNWPWVRTGENQLTTYVQVYSRTINTRVSLQKKYASFQGLAIKWEVDKDTFGEKDNSRSIYRGTVEVPKDVDILSLLG